MITTQQQSEPLTPDQIAANQARFEADSREGLSSWWRNADLPPCYPATSETVAEIMVANEYRCDVDVLRRYIDEKAIRCPARINGRLHWMASDIMVLAAALEFRRAWKSFSRLHGHKLTQFEKLQELAEANGHATCFEDLAVWDIAGLLALLHEPGCDLGARQALAVALRHVIKLKGIEL